LYGVVIGGICGPSGTRDQVESVLTGKSWEMGERENPNEFESLRNAFIFEIY